MSTYLPLVVVGSFPIFVSAVLYWMNKKLFSNLNPRFKQIMFGIIFGAIAIFGTENSILINGVGMNARDAAPICAGLFFGWPAAIISSLIGGIERWFAVYWGAGQVSRLACTIGTIFSGVVAAFMSVKVFDNKSPKVGHAFAVGLVCETFHMLLVFLTNVNNVEVGFYIVKLCTIPMVSAVSISVAVTAYIINILNKKFYTEDENDIVDISSVFQKNLLIVMTISFLLTNIFCVVLQKNLASSQTNKLLLLNIQDVVKQVDETVDSHMKNKLDIVKNQLLKYDYKKLTTKELVEIANSHQIEEINLIENNIIYSSSESNYLNFDMNSSDQTMEFVKAFSDSNTKYHVQEFRNQGYDSSISRKYAAVYLNENEYLQIAYSQEQLDKDISETLLLLVHNRRVGQTGSFIIADSNGNVISDFDGSLLGMNFDDFGLSKDFTGQIVGERYKASINGIDSYYTYYITNGYIIITFQPVEEASYAENISTYLMTFVEITVFAGVFIIVYFLIRNSIVKNVKVINKDLEKITSGDLDVVLNVRDTKEFSTLSDQINTTVSKLKVLIHEAEKRMETELQYAADIQRSSLPIDFPHKKEIDLFASMDPAKEVGGDFYDFFFLKDNKLAILMADVSGKGVPAALFMMRAKSTIKSYAEYGIEVNDILTNTNYRLTEGNDAGLFVTCWIGILDLSNGHLVYSNAGHCAPLIRKPGRQYEYLQSKPDFVLGGLEGIVYKKYELDLEEGTELFLYTDGLTEAQNINEELYGESRLKDNINKSLNLESKLICENVKLKIYEFQGEANQFDDMTMLHLNFKKKTTN